MKKFQYAELVESYNHGVWVWVLDNDIVSPRFVTGWKEIGIKTFGAYEQVSLVQILNILGADGWQAVSIKFPDSGSESAILMREVLE